MNNKYLNAILHEISFFFIKNKDGLLNEYKNLIFKIKYIDNGIKFKITITS
jgi:hypothetical protein